MNWTEIFLGECDTSQSLPVLPCYPEEKKTHNFMLQNMHYLVQILFQQHCHSTSLHAVMMELFRYPQKMHSNSVAVLTKDFAILYLHTKVKNISWLASSFLKSYIASKSQFMHSCQPTIKLSYHCLFCIGKTLISLMVKANNSFSYFISFFFQIWRVALQHELIYKVPSIYAISSN